MADDSSLLQLSLYHRQQEQTEPQEEEQEPRESEELYEGVSNIQSSNSNILPSSGPFDTHDFYSSEYNNYVPSPISLSETYSNSGCDSYYTDSDDDMNFVTNLFEHRRDYVVDDYQSSVFLDSPFVNESVDFRVFGSDHQVEEELGVGFGDEIDRLESGVSGLRVAGIESESDIEDEMDEVNDVRLEGVGGRREGFGWVIDRIEEVTVSSEISLEDGGNGSANNRGAGMRDLEWEVFLAANNYNMDFELQTANGVTYITVHDGYIYAEHISLLAQVVETETESDVSGSPPAAKSVVENLASVVLTQQYAQENNVVCAICKDELSVEEIATRLPCSHHYHGECIIPWLNIRNTCPVCRFELTTDDAEYERMKGRRGGLGLIDDLQMRYNI